MYVLVKLSPTSTISSYPTLSADFNCSKQHLAEVCTSNMKQPNEWQTHKFSWLCTSSKVRLSFLFFLFSSFPGWYSVQLFVFFKAWRTSWPATWEWQDNFSGGYHVFLPQQISSQISCTSCLTWLSSVLLSYALLSFLLSCIASWCLYCFTFFSLWIRPRCLCSHIFWNSFPLFSLYIAASLCAFHWCSLFSPLDVFFFSLRLSIRPAQSSAGFDVTIPLFFLPESAQTCSHPHELPADHSWYVWESYHLSGPFQSSEIKYSIFFSFYHNSISLCHKYVSFLVAS